mmetsp:Transcript_27004/g.85817  ORF Transcript_27004/g.85817 Transcript_27004/m.85817 type:complete len:242 (-) Transcript_27004:2-727(-)
MAMKPVGRLAPSGAMAGLGRSPTLAGCNGSRAAGRASGASASLERSRDVPARGRCTPAMMLWMLSSRASSAQLSGDSPVKPALRRECEEALELREEVDGLYSSCGRAGSSRGTPRSAGRRAEAGVSLDTWRDVRDLAREGRDIGGRLARGGSGIRHMGVEDLEELQRLEAVEALEVACPTGQLLSDSEPSESAGLRLRCRGAREECGLGGAWGGATACLLKVAAEAIGGIFAGVSALKSQP